MSYELPPADDKVRNQLCSSTIGFLKIRQNGEIVDPTSLGSGTLVTAKGIHGILTAAHVLDNLPEDEPLGILLFTRPDTSTQFKVEIRREDKIFTPGWSRNRKLPDLGFMRLYPPRIADLEARGCVFYNLEKERTIALNARRELAWREYVVGVVAESEIRRVVPDGGGYVRSGYTMLIGDSQTRRRFCAESCNLVAQSINFKEPVAPPSSYGGVSGGGLWVLASPTGEIRDAKRALVGIVFRETSSKRSARMIICHRIEDVRDLILPQLPS